MPKEAAEIFAENVEARLAELGESKEWLGKAVGQDGSAVRKALSERRAIRIDTLIEYAKALRTTPDALLGYSRSAETERELRLACISAIFKIDMKHLSVVRDFLEKMAPEHVNSVAKGQKSGSS